MLVARLRKTRLVDESASNTCGQFMLVKCECHFGPWLCLEPGISAQNGYAVSVEQGTVALCMA